MHWECPAQRVIGRGLIPKDMSAQERMALQFAEVKRLIWRREAVFVLLVLFCAEWRCLCDCSLNAESELWLVMHHSVGGGVSCYSGLWVIQRDS